jgi:hypothetical protein
VKCDYSYIFKNRCFNHLEQSLYGGSTYKNE